jgi:NAD(P)-dependent dehydrogenase (short-subunit alcohol dehydrogenase family)
MIGMEKTGYDFQNYNTIITGAEGEIGRAISELFASVNSTLILVDQQENQDRLHSFADTLQHDYGIATDCFGIDLRNTHEITEFAETMKKHYDTIQVLINNAGINKIMPAQKYDEADWDDIVNTNLKGTFFISQRIGELMLRHKRGAIINVASQHGVVGNEKRAPYCASKAGIINMSRSLAIEWAKFGVRINCVSPSYVIHDKNSDYLKNPAVAREYLSRIPLGRYCRPIDVAYAVLFLASPMAEFITGHNLMVDGGYTAQ